MTGPAVLVWFSPSVFGAATLHRSLVHGLTARGGAALRVVSWNGSGTPPDSCVAAVIVCAGLPSDVAAAAAARARLASLPADAVILAFVPAEGMPAGEASAALGIPPDVWPPDVRAMTAADRAAAPLSAVEPRSRLTAAVAAACERLLRAAAASPRPPLDPSDVAAHVADRVWAAIDDGGLSGVQAAIDRELAAFLAVAPGALDAEGIEAVRSRLHQELIGLGPIERYFADPLVSEIMVNGASDIFVERNGRIERAPACYASDERLRLAISRIVNPAGRRVDLSSPLCDVRLADGSRANVVLPPVSVGGPVLTVRRFRPAFDRLEDLVSAGTLTDAEAARLAEAVRERRNLLIAGNSGAGKTTLLNALAALIPDEERIITMEDAAELRIRKSHVVRLETRPANAEGAGEITMRELVVNALRMRPDRLIVGECRGAEAVPMLQAMNTGHDGSMTTIHGNSAAEAVERLESMTLIGAPHWPADVVRRQIRAAVHLVIYLRRSGGRRRLESIHALKELAS